MLAKMKAILGKKSVSLKKIEKNIYFEARRRKAQGLWHFPNVAYRKFGLANPKYATFISFPRYYNLLCVI